MSVREATETKVYCKNSKKLLSLPEQTIEYENTSEGEVPRKTEQDRN